MEFINGNCTLTAEEHKEFVRFLFEQERKGSKLTRQIEDIGFVLSDGLVSDVCSTAYEAVLFLTCADVAEKDSFICDFFDATDFEEFYQKYYTKGEF